MNIRNGYGNYVREYGVNISFLDDAFPVIVGMDGPGGPGGGDPIKLGFLAASDNILALDWKCASLVGYDPFRVVYLRQAMERKIWLNNPGEITTLGAPETECGSTSFKIVNYGT